MWKSYVAPGFNTVILLPSHLWGSVYWYYHVSLVVYQHFHTINDFDLHKNLGAREACPFYRQIETQKVKRLRKSSNQRVTELISKLHFWLQGQGLFQCTNWFLWTRHAGVEFTPIFLLSALLLGASLISNTTGPPANRLFVFCAWEPSHLISS